MPTGVNHSIERGSSPACSAAAISCAGWIHRGYWIDIGTPEKYLAR